jgi:hypothetical protein
MPRRKKKIHWLKKKLHPMLSYAFLLGLGAVAISSTAQTVGTETVAASAPNLPAVRAEASSPAPQRDLSSLKASAAEFADQLSIIKGQIAELQSYGRVPPAALMDAIGEGEQLADVIAKAQSLTDIGESDPATKLQQIGRRISQNAKF